MLRIDGNAEVHKKYIFIKKSKTEVTVLLNGQYCWLKIVAVGGGGGPSGEQLAGGFGAGGSGYVVYQAIQMLGRSSNQFWVKVGSGGKRGKGGKDTTIDWGLTPAYFRAQGGASGDGVVGGAGYSGGGGANGGGGSDGSAAQQPYVSRR